MCLTKEENKLECFVIEMFYVIEMLFEATLADRLMSLPIELIFFSLSILRLAWKKLVGNKHSSLFCSTKSQEEKVL